MGYNLVWEDEELPSFRSQPYVRKFLRLNSCYYFKTPWNKFTFLRALRLLKFVHFRKKLLESSIVLINSWERGFSGVDPVRK